MSMMRCYSGPAVTHHYHTDSADVTRRALRIAHTLGNGYAIPLELPRQSWQSIPEILPLPTWNTVWNSTDLNGVSVHIAVFKNVPLRVDAGTTNPLETFSIVSCIIILSNLVALSWMILPYIWEGRAKSWFFPFSWWRYSKAVFLNDPVKIWSKSCHNFLSYFELNIQMYINKWQWKHNVVSGWKQ